MPRKYAETINMGEEENPILVKLYEDEEKSETVAYALKSYRTLSELGQDMKVPKNAEIEVYSARLPQFNEGTRMNAAFIEPSPYEKNVFWIVMDERLKPEEELAVAFHEVSHLINGYHSNERITQEKAIDALMMMARSYEELNKPQTKEDLMKKGNNYDISEKNKLEIGKAAKHLINAKAYFGIDNQDLEDMGIVERQRKNNLERYFGFIPLSIGFYLLLSSSTITGNVINNTIPNFPKGITGLGLIVLAIALFIWQRK